MHSAAPPKAEVSSTLGHRRFVPRAAIDLGTYLPVGWASSMLRTIPGKSTVLRMGGSRTAVGGGTPESSDAGSNGHCVQKKIARADAMN
jgi:hypothetical protein